MGNLITLTNWTVWDYTLAGGAGAARVIRITDGTGYNHPSAPGFYEPRAALPALYLTAVSADPRRSAPTVSGGGIEISNADFGLTDPDKDIPANDWAGQTVFDFGFVGHPIEHLLGYDDQDYSTFIPILIGKTSSLTVNKRSLTVAFKDPLQTFQEPLALYEFAGTNSLPAGTEGAATDRKGAHKPVTLGYVFNVPAIQVNTSRDIYQVADGAIYDIPAVYQAGVSKTKGSARTFANIDNGSAPTGGTYDYHLGGTGGPPASGAFLRLGTTTTNPITADVAGEPHTNLALYAEEFDNAAWVKTSLTVSANATTNSKGAATADKLVEAAATAEHTARQSFAITAASVYCVSVEVKAAGRDFARVTLEDNGSTTGIRLDIDLTSGEGTLATFGTASLENYGVADLGSGWYRIAVVGKIDGAATTAYARVQPASALGTVSYLGDITKGIYATRAQFELAAPTEYLVTTSATVTAAKTSAADISHAVVADRAGVSVNLGDVMKVNHLAAWATGFFNRDDVTIAQALDVIGVGGLLKWYLEQNVFRMFHFQDPEDAPDCGLAFKQFFSDVDASSTDIDIKDWSLQNGGDASTPGGQIPVYKVTVGYQHFWETQTDGLDAFITATRRSDLQAEYRWTDPTTDADVLDAFPDAINFRLETQLKNKADAETLRDLLFPLFSIPRALIQIEAELEASQANLLRFGYSVPITIRGLGYSARRGLILGKLYNAKSKKLQVFVWV